MALSREQILAKRLDVPRKAVDVPHLGTVNVRVMPLAQVVKIQERKPGSEAAVLPWLAIATVCDDEGRLLFTEADYDALAELPADSLVAIAAAAGQLNKTGDEGFEAARKNSETTPASGSA